MPVVADLVTMTSIFVAATRQHVGKSSSCLGIVNSMKQKFGKCGFIKPVGQQSKHLAIYCITATNTGLSIWPTCYFHVRALHGLSAAVIVGDGLQVDKDVKLMHDYFGLEDNYADMSPMVLPSGYTKDFIDGKIKASRGLLHACQSIHLASAALLASCIAAPKLA